ncbi:hypothetical protein ACFSCX_06900 [Bacillus salitolerans]|uniref:Phosphatase n=1 Tax=Bacillus salitolerans TaxID=1437434 RepID=A0ABW4LMM4_9BACI
MRILLLSSLLIFSMIHLSQTDIPLVEENEIATVNPLEDEPIYPPVG